MCCRIIHLIAIYCVTGMMTGQLLGGAPPLVAAEYQMAIIWLVWISKCPCGIKISSLLHLS